MNTQNQLMMNKYINKDQLEANKKTNDYNNPDS